LKQLNELISGVQCQHRILVYDRHRNLIRIVEVNARRPGRWMSDPSIGAELMEQRPAGARRGQGRGIGCGLSSRARCGQADGPQAFAISGERQNLLMIGHFRTIRKAHSRSRSRKPRPGHAVVLEDHQLRAFAANLDDAIGDARKLLPLGVADFFAIEDLRARAGRVFRIVHVIGDPDGIDRIGPGGAPAAVHHHIGRLGGQDKWRAKHEQNRQWKKPMRSISHRPHPPV